MKAKIALAIFWFWATLVIACHFVTDGDNSPSSWLDAAVYVTCSLGLVGGLIGILGWIAHGVDK